MNDGIDRKAFAATLRSLDPEDRRRRSREFGLWLRAASRNTGPFAKLGLFLVCAAPAMFFFGYRLRPETRVVEVLAIAFLGVGSLLNLYSARRAREWRRAHPFEQWRAVP